MGNEPSEPKLSVIICTFNRAERLAKCLESLTKQTFKDFEVIIVDGGSTDGTLKVTEKSRNSLNTRTVTETRTELAQVRDRGWREARGEYVSWIDDDVVVSPSWAEEIVHTLDENPDVSGVSGPTIVPEEILKNRDVFFFYGKSGLMELLGKFWNWFFLEGQMYEVGRLTRCGAWTPGSNFPSAAKIEELREVDYLEACNMTLRRSLIEKVGGYDYGYTKVAEWCELDLAMRVAELGYRLVFNPRARVEHHISQGGVFSRRTHAKERMENFLKFYFRHIFGQPLISEKVAVGPPDLPTADSGTGWPAQDDTHVTATTRFLVYLLFLNLYWTYKAIQTGNLDWLGGWLGTLTGLWRNLVSKTESKKQPTSTNTP